MGTRVQLIFQKCTITGIEPCSCVTEISLKILKLMVVVIGKKTPQPTHLRGNPISAPYLFFVFDIFLFFFHQTPYVTEIYKYLLSLVSLSASEYKGCVLILG